jgi:dipeptidyl aminopeptidase/acylaminoacyl peptidase
MQPASNNESQGYAVLSPNYGGSAGHGEKFAARVRDRSGNYDYSDMIDFLKEAIKQGIVDGKRCGIIG